jgi:predicted lipoprotein
MSSFVSRRAALCAGLATALSLSGCKIVRDADKAALDPADPNNFDAKVYVEALWDRKAVPFFDERAFPIAKVVQALAKDKDAAGNQFGRHAGGEGTPWTFAVRGTGIVKSVTTGSRHGEMVVDAGAPGHPLAVTLQVGPVIFGTAVRDSLPFIAFGDFVNQIQYAEVSRALNDRAAALAHAGLTPPPRVGGTIEFIGAMTDPSMTGEPTVTAVRVRSRGVWAK